MFIINFYECGESFYHHFRSNDLSDCLDYLEAVFCHFSEYHQNVTFKFSFCYEPKEVLEDVQS